MKIDTCLVSCNLDDFYLDFYPVVRDVWKRLCDIRCVLVLVGDRIPDKLKHLEQDIILFKPEPNVHPIFQSQMIRLLYAAVMKNASGVIVSDIDMIPTRKSYYTDIPLKFTDDHFVVYRDVLICDRQYPICYNCATPNVWGNIFGISSDKDIRQRLREFSPAEFDGRPGYQGWFTDQLVLFETVNKWNSNTGNLVILNDNYTNFSRLDRIRPDHMNDLETTRKKVSQGEFTDFHMPRPYSQNKYFIDKIVDSLVQKN